MRIALVRWACVGPSVELVWRDSTPDFTVGKIAECFACPGIE